MISCSDFFSRSIASASRSDSGSEKSMCGLETRGQWKLGEEIGLARIGIRQAHGVAGAAVKGVAEMQNLGAAFAVTGRHVLRTFQSIAALSVFSIASAPPSMKR